MATTRDSWNKLVALRVHTASCVTHSGCPSTDRQRKQVNMCLVWVNKWTSEHMFGQVNKWTSEHVFVCAFAFHSVCLYCFCLWLFVWSCVGLIHCLAVWGLFGNALVCLLACFVVCLSCLSSFVYGTTCAFLIVLHFCFLLSVLLCLRACFRYADCLYWLVFLCVSVLCIFVLACLIWLFLCLVGLV